MGNLEVSFGICLSPEYDANQLQNLVDSIGKKSDTVYEVNLIGKFRNDVNLPKNSNIIDFDETQKKGWITKKKNMLVNNSKYDIVCLIHDYYILHLNWHEGMSRYTNENPNWDILMNRVHRCEGDRHSDWLVNQKYMDKVLEKYPDLHNELYSVAPDNWNGARWVCGLPYSEQSLAHLQYISGGYILAKKSVLTDVALDESFVWGQAEDLAWSESVINFGYRFQFNPYSDVSIQKPNKWKVGQMTDECVRRLKEIFDNGH